MVAFVEFCSLFNMQYTYLRTLYCVCSRQQRPVRVGEEEEAVLYVGEGGNSSVGGCVFSDIPSILQINGLLLLVLLPFLCSDI